MTTANMPLILDNPLAPGAMQVDLGDVDDLFGDAPLALPSRPPSKRLLQRIDELRSRGACQGLAWSKTGTIASIAPDGQSLDLRYLRAHPKDATWGLSDPTSCTPWTNLAGGPVVHLTWAPTQTSELAIIDAVGRVAMVNISTNINRPTIARKWDADPVDDLNAVVGTYWLNTLPSHRGTANPLHAPAIKQGENYTYQTQVLLANAPFHPNPSRSALLCVTANAMMKMFWHQNTGHIQETQVELESTTSADDLVTHAAITSDTRAKCMFVALATSSKQLEVFQVGLSWGLASQDNAKGTLPTGQPLGPSLKGRHCAITSWLPSAMSDSHLAPSMTQLSFIEFIPTMLASPNKAWTHPVILTVRSFVPNVDAPYAQDGQSIIDRWELILDQPQSLHPAFENLGSRRNSAGLTPPATWRLKHLEPITVNKIVTGVNIIRLATVISFSYSDGTVEFRDRQTMEELWTTPNLDRINSIHEAGFTQGGEPNCLQTALSPTLYSIAQMCEDGNVKWHGLDYTYADPTSLDSAQQSAIIAALTMSTAQAAASMSSIDDILAVTRHFTGQQEFAGLWVTEMVRMMRIAVDYSEESQADNLVRNNLLQQCFSILNHLGWSGEFQPRTFQGKLSMFALGLRNIVILITIANNSPGHMKDRTPLDEPEVVEALAGCCKWSMDLLCWLADCLFCLLDDSKFQDILKDPQQSGILPYLRAKTDISLHMMLSSPVRGLLSAVCRRMNHLQTIAKRAVEYYQSRGNGSSSNDTHTGAAATGITPPTLYQAYHKLMVNSRSTLIDVGIFDKLLTQLGRDIREQYSKSFTEMHNRARNNSGGNNKNNPNGIEEAVKRTQSHCETTLLLGGSPPGALHKVVLEFFSKDLRKFREHCSPAKLFFKDYELLEADDEPKALAARRQKGLRVDLFKRMEIFPQSQGQETSTESAAGGDGRRAGDVAWRRCVRCASVMEDTAAHLAKPGIIFVLSQQRNCSCGARLAILPKGKLVG